MTAELVNLRRARKAKAREDAAAIAAQNRAMFGRSGADRTLQTMTVALETRRLEGHRLAASCAQDGAEDDGG